MSEEIKKIEEMEKDRGAGGTKVALEEKDLDKVAGGKSYFESQSNTAHLK